MMKRAVPRRLWGLPLESFQGLGLHDHSPAEGPSQCQLLMGGFCASLLDPKSNFTAHPPAPHLRVYTYIDKYLFSPTADSVLSIV